MEEFHCFDDCFFSFEATLISPKAHMDIPPPAFDNITLIQINLLPIIFYTGAIISIYLNKIYFAGSITPIPEPRTLGGMGHGTTIFGIKVLQLIFHKGTLISPLLSPIVKVSVAPQYVLNSH